MLPEAEQRHGHLPALWGTGGCCSPTTSSTNQRERCCRYTGWGKTPLQTGLSHGGGLSPGPTLHPGGRLSPTARPGGWEGDPRGVAEDDVGRDLQRTDLRDDVIVEVPTREVLLGRAGTRCSPKTCPEAPQSLGAAPCPSPHPLWHLPAQLGQRCFGASRQSQGVWMGSRGRPTPLPQEPAPTGTLVLGSPGTAACPRAGGQGWVTFCGTCRAGRC